MNTPVQLYQYDGISPIEPRSFKETISDDDAAKTLFLICYSMIPQNGVEKFISEIFDGTPTRTTKEEFIKSLWDCCSDNFHKISNAEKENNLSE